MRGRWRLFRHDAGKVSGLPPLAYVVLFVACLALGIWSARTYHAVIVWPANGVLVAALLLLHRRRAIQVVAACFLINLLANLWRGDDPPFWWLNAVLNLGEAVLAAVVARRVGGAALDLRRPKRLWRFAALAVVPAVTLAAVVAIGVAASSGNYSVTKLEFAFHRYMYVEIVSLLIAAPALLLIAKAHRFRSAAPAGAHETILLLALLMGATVMGFFQTTTPAAFIIFPLLVLVAFRVSPVWVAAAVIGIAILAATATVNGMGPVTLARPVAVQGLEDVPLLLRQLSLYYIFLLCVLVTALPVSAIMSERRRMTERLHRRTEAAHAARLRAEEADAAKSRFLALMSHEMRTPLNSIAGYAEVLSRRPGMDVESLEHLNHVQRSGEALLMLVEDVLEASSGDETLHEAPLWLEAVVAAAVEPSRIVAEAKGLTLDVEVRPDATVGLIGDQRRLRQALHHLVQNAVKFTDQGGVRVLADRLDGHVLIAVTDTGCGMDADKTDRLFDAFVQGDDSISRTHVGAGIGLTLVRRHARLMGGEVVIDSRPGDGATITLRLPLEDAPEETAVPVVAASAPIESDEDEGRPLRVLVVDDHPANREVARLMLEAAGCDVQEACDGDEAIEMAAMQDFDLILMDVRMPRVDGLTATRAIRATGDTTPILAVTADAMPEDAAACIAAGMNAHLAKPISHAALYAAMERLLFEETSATQAA